MSFPRLYEGSLYPLPQEFLKSMTTRETKKGMMAALEVWLSIVFIILGIRFIQSSQFFWSLYIPLAFFIAGRQGALLQLMHEAIHGNLVPSKKMNDFLGKWLGAHPIGINYSYYKIAHAQHHAQTNANDPKEDAEKYKISDFRNIRLYLLFLKDLSGLSALETFWNTRSPHQKIYPPEKGARYFASLSLVQIILFATLFQSNLFNYVFLWIIPIISPHMFLMRIRGIAEHGLLKQLGIPVPHGRGDQGIFYTRSFLTPVCKYRFIPFIWIEKILIGSLSVHYHHEHHLFPKVPFYHLKKLHEKIAKTVFQNNPEVYASGYFSAAMRNLWISKS